MSKPDIKPIAVKQYEVKQSKYEQVPKLPCRTLLRYKISIEHFPK